MKAYEFELRFNLGAADADPEQFLDRLHDCGCDDALVGIGKRGRIGLSFNREAQSARDAILSAIKDVKRAIPDAQFIEAAPDFVGVTDIATYLGFSRQNMRKILDRAGAAFPAPAHDGNRPMWHLEPVLQWFAEAEGREIEPPLLEVAQAAMSVNVARDQAHLSRRTADGFLARVARSI